MTDTAKPPSVDWDREYRAFQDREGVPVHEGLYVEDVRTVEMAEWDRTGGRGAFINLLGMEGTCDIQIHEIPAQESLERQRHLHDQLVFVMSGSGATVIGEGDDQRTFEWDQHAFFYLPKNTPYTHTNLADEPAQLFVETPLPLLYSLLKADEPIWNVDSWSEWTGKASDEAYSTVAELTPGEDGRRWYWESNFVPDALKIELKDQSYRGGSSTNARFPFRDSASWSHISEFPPGKYKKAHRHLCGANVLLISGEGYSLLWQEDDEERTKVDWKPYSLFTPPTLWYHQHFNTSEDPARYLVFHSHIKGTGMQMMNDATSPRAPSNEIEYPNEDPAVRELFEEELAKKGLENEMDPAIYESD